MVVGATESCHFGKHITAQTTLAEEIFEFESRPGLRVTGGDHKGG